MKSWEGKLHKIRKTHKHTDGGHNMSLKTWATDKANQTTNLAHNQVNGSNQLRGCRLARHLQAETQKPMLAEVIYF